MYEQPTHVRRRISAGDRSHRRWRSPGGGRIGGYLRKRSRKWETGLLYSLETGIDGLTPPVELPAPPRAESLTPGTPTPFARYNVEIRKDGYNRVTNLGVPVFDGIVSTQPVLLLPTVLGDETGEDIVESPETGNALYGGGRKE